MTTEKPLHFYLFITFKKKLSMVVNKSAAYVFFFFFLEVICFQSCCRSYNYLLKRSVCYFHSVSFGASRLQNTGSFNMLHQCRFLKGKCIKNFVCVHANNQRVDHFIGFGSLYYFSTLFFKIYFRTYLSRNQHILCFV